MVELDEAVMRVVREHMPSVAGGALDCYKGEWSKVFHRAICLKTFAANFIIVGNCAKL